MVIHRTLLEAAPPNIAKEVDQNDERKILSRWALWDLMEGARLWKMWVRQSQNEVRRRYNRTALGPIWVTVSLIIFATVLSFVWAGLWKMKVTEFMPFLLSGLVPWTMISSIIGEACGVIIGGESLIKSRQFPYTSLMYGMLARNLIIFAHNIVGYVIVAALCGVAFGWQILLLLPGLAIVLMNCAWISIVVAIFCLRFRDFQQLVASLLQISVFVTPIFWKANQLQGKRALIVDMNPLHHMVEIMRQPLLGVTPELLSYGVCIVTALIGWFFAYRLFASKRHRLAYWF